ncbi:Rieske (2Fe-2S) protein [Allokutzneria oryzae]|uniref:Rieske (2Fe-2S) protein n=1 Tax=Allokutzneria oryzae TaxID=1378989 RepID=A0ABV5ZSJ2_9PSEU
MTRRNVLCGLVGLTVAGCGGGGTRPAAGTGTAKPGTALVGLSELPVGGGKLVDVPGGGRLLIVRTRAGQVRAFDPRCPHTGSIVSAPAGGQVDCPTHGSTFDAETGDLRKGPATTGLTPVGVRADGDRVVLA